jgi:hypothetical protein
MKTIAELIELLKTKDQAAEVEFIVCKTDGEIVVCDVQKQAQPIIKMLKWFK